MKRIFCLLCAAALCLGLCACGEKTQKIDMYELEKSMISADKTLPEMKVTGSWEENAQMSSILCEKDRINFRAFMPPGQTLS